MSSAAVFYLNFCGTCPNAHFEDDRMRGSAEHCPDSTLLWHAVKSAPQENSIIHVVLYQIKSSTNYIILELKVLLHDWFSILNLDNLWQNEIIDSGLV